MIFPNASSAASMVRGRLGFHMNPRKPEPIEPVVKNMNSATLKFGDNGELSIRKIKIRRNQQNTIVQNNLRKILKRMLQF